MDAKDKVERLHVALGTRIWRVIDDYRHAARLDTRSDAIRELVNLAVGRRQDAPPEHLRALKIMEQFQEPITPESKTSKGKGGPSQQPR